MPISWYDWSGRLIRQSVTDPNGFYEVMLPSTNRINYPSPAGVCARLVHAGRQRPVDGRPDRARPGSGRPEPAPRRPEPGLRPAVPVDLDPVRDVGRPHDDHRPRVSEIGVAVNGPGRSCRIRRSASSTPTQTPQLFAANRVYATRPSNVAGWTAADRTFTLTGTGFGAGATVSAVNEDPRHQRRRHRRHRSRRHVRHADARTAITFTLGTGTAAGAYQVYITNNVSSSARSTC